MGVSWCSSSGLKVRENGQLTSCFVDTLLLIPTAVVVFVLFPVLALILRREPKVFGQTCARFQYHSQRWILTMLLLLCLLAKVGEGFMLQEMISTTPLHLYVPNMLSLLCLIIVTIFYDMVEVSGENPVQKLLILLLYWVSSLIVWAVKFVRLYQVEGPFDVRLYTNLCMLVFHTLLLIIERRVIFSHLPKRSRSYKWTRADQEEEEEGAEDCRGFKEGHVKFVHDFANLLSRLTYNWLTSMLSLGNSRPLEHGDLGELPTVDRSDFNHELFVQVWEKEKNRAAKRKTVPSLWRSYFLAYRSLIIKSAICRLVGDLLSFIGPLSLKQIVKYVEKTLNSEDSSTEKPDDESDIYLSASEFFGNGFVLAVVILIGNIAMSSLIQYYMHLTIRFGMNLRAALQVRMLIMHA